MALQLFSDNMMKASLSLETIAAKLTYFREQLQLIHWQTAIYAEHMAIGSLYDYIDGFKDDVIEKIMGYSGMKPKAFKIQPITDNMNSTVLVNEIKNWASELSQYAETNNYPDIENMAQELSGHAAKTLYLLTLS